MSSQDIALMAHLLRRAGFGATRDELEAFVADGYEATVEGLLHPGEPGHIPDDILRRYHVGQAEFRLPTSAAGYWLYRMITTRNHLEEKTALFWHGLFATSSVMGAQLTSLVNQVGMFRECGLGSFRDLLVELSQDPAMLFWLDNNDNHKDAINENYGRELLELFSMGVGNYTEDDIKECARAFTGWTLGDAEYMALRSSKNSIWPYGRTSWKFEYRAHDHDDEDKTFLGETGRFNGEDIVDIVVKQPATAAFISRRLFQFFVADEVDEEGEQVVAAAAEIYFESGYEVRAVLRTLFNSEYFKSEKARFARVKGPVEHVVGAVRMAGSYRQPTLDMDNLAKRTVLMGQGLLRPPSVEGWHEGAEWIDSGGLMERVNFVANELGNVELPGVRAIVHRVATGNGGVLSPQELVDRCLDQIGPVQVSDETRAVLTEHVSRRGDLDLRDHECGDESERRVGEVLSLIASNREYQMG